MSLLGSFIVTLTLPECSYGTRSSYPIADSVRVCCVISRHFSGVYHRSRFVYRLTRGSFVQNEKSGLDDAVFILDQGVCGGLWDGGCICLLYTSPSPRDGLL